MRSGGCRGRKDDVDLRPAVETRSFDLHIQALINDSHPLTLMRERLLVQQAAGEWSSLLYTLYTLNPLAGIVDGMQNVPLRGTPPDAQALLPGMLAVALLLPLSDLYFKRAEAYFADVI
jgi:lipopolysaccharide transport system permease protein